MRVIEMKGKNFAEFRCAETKYGCVLFMGGLNNKSTMENDKGQHSFNTSMSSFSLCDDENNNCTYARDESMLSLHRRCLKTYTRDESMLSLNKK